MPSFQENTGKTIQFIVKQWKRLSSHWKKRMNGEQSFPPGHEFPSEIILEILSRLTVQSLLRCKCVCKRWNEIIQERKFIEMHMERGSWGFYYKRIDRSTESSTYFDSLDGLIVERSNHLGTYRVKNPSIRKVLEIPDPAEEIKLMKILYIRSANLYKLVCLHHINGENATNLGCKIQTLVTQVEHNDLTWRPIQSSILHGWNILRLTLSLVVIDTTLCCVGISKDGTVQSQIICLNVENEVMDSLITIPHTLYDNWENVFPIKWDERLSLVSIVEEDLHVWVLEDLIGKNWAENKMIIHLEFLESLGNMLLQPIFGTSEAVWFFKDRVQVLIYHIESRNVWTSRSAPNGKTIKCCASASMVTLQGMQPDVYQHRREVEYLDIVM